MRALAKQLNDRYQSAAALAVELRSVAAILDIRAGEREPAGLIQARPPTGRRWPARLASVVVLVLLAGAVGWAWQLEARRLWRRWFGPAILPVIAVVPLDAGDTGRDYFASGLTDDLITRLGQIPGLKVVGRASMCEYRGMDLETIAQQLDAGVLLTGWVRPVGGQIHLRVELVEPQDGMSLWTGDYTSDISQVFAVQTELAEAVARELRIALEPSAARAR